MQSISVIDYRRWAVANIQDVARHAGVSTATVSRFLAGERVRSHDAVAAAVEALDYRP
ncbi:LacI family DNA-binding transcriptional regulator, partial [Nocardioides kribbensis]|uniref:LacI family DNA-binding transcriptional regulator n=1 Tax=Nocardioides kribbensis TaxID=305517 RepID=UPI0032DA8A8B